MMNISQKILHSKKKKQLSCGRRSSRLLHLFNRLLTTDDGGYIITTERLTNSDYAVEELLEKKYACVRT